MRAKHLFVAASRVRLAKGPALPWGLAGAAARPPLAGFSNMKSRPRDTGGFQQSTTTSAIVTHAVCTFHKLVRRGRV
jgi:hypothetical protein